MSETNQATADSNDQSTVADPLQDAANSTQSGTNHFADYEAELAAALADDTGTNRQAAEAAADEPEFEAVGTEEIGESTEVLSEEDEPAEAKARERFRFKDPADQAVAAIAKAKGITLIEAARLYAGEIPTKRDDETATTQADTAPKDTVKSVQARIDELEALDAQASMILEFETALGHRREANKLRNQLMDLKISEVQAKSIREQREATSFNDAYTASETQAVTYYPDVTRADSPLVKRMVELDAQAQRLGDPVFTSPEKPFLLAKAAARELGILMTDPKKQPATKQAVRPMQPASGNARTTATAPAVRQEEAIDKIDGIQDYEKFVAGLR